MLVFDRYYTNSTKSYMRKFRQEKNGGRVHILTAEMPLPPKTSIIVGVTKNKVQLNKMLAGAMVDHQFYRHATVGQMDSCTVASTEDVPVEIVGATVIERRDLEVTKNLIHVHLLCQICLPFMPLQGPTHQQLHLALERSKHSRWPELLGSRYMLLEIHKQMKLLYSSKLRHSYWLATAKVSADVPA